MSSSLQFPSQGNIQTYLEKHPRTNNAYNKEKKVLEVAAKTFANTQKTFEGVQMGVTFMLFDLGISQQALMPIMADLMQALQDCAEGK